MKGFPNFFGPQRFGRNGKNLQTAERLFGGDLKRIDRTARSMALSSARAWLFNASVSERLSQCAIDDALIGDALQLDGTQSFFAHDGSDGTVVDRIAARDVHPTGPMWGGGAQPVAGEVAEMESAVAARYPVFAEGLVKAGLKQQRRALRVIPQSLEWSLPKDDCLQLRFDLPSGAFATALLRELVNVDS